MISAQSNIPLPYSVEYAKSQRSNCKKCKKFIGEKELRMSMCQPSTFFDGNIDNWFHFNCFWTKLNKAKDDINVKSIRGFDWLQWEDQEMLRNRIKQFHFEKTPSPERPPRKILVFSSIKTEKSATSRGKCGQCSGFFEKGEIKIHMKKWLHPKCAFESVDQCVDTIESIPGWNEYSEDARKKFTDEFEKVKQEKQPEEEEKKASTSSESSPPSEVVRVQSEVTEEQPNKKRTVECIDLEDDDEITVIQEVTSPIKRMRIESSEIEEKKVEKVEEEEDCLAKRRRLGREAKLAELKKQKMKTQVDTLWEYRKLFDELSNVDKQFILQYNDQDIPDGHDPTAQLMDRLADNALFGCPIGCPQCPNGRIVYNSSRRTYVCTGYATEYSKCQYEHKNPVRTPFRLPDRFVRRIVPVTAFNGMSERLYMEEDEEEQIVRHRTKNAQNSSNGVGGPGFIYAAEALDSMNRVPTRLADITSVNTHIIKNGTLVDAKFKFAGECHVYKDETDGTLYQATLSFTDLTQNKNSYYKIQLLKDDCHERYYVFRSWGRVGTDVGDTKTELHGNLNSAILEFLDVFREKTGNEWKFRKYFRKQAGRFNYVETDFSEFEDIVETDVLPGSKSTLPDSVKQIVMSIFDVENMKSALKSFEMDVNKMPLGKLSSKQINQAFEVLTVLGDLLTEYPVQMGKIVDATNKFYTIIPHNFGMKVPEPIDSLHKVKDKNNMLNALLDIKFAYDQIYGGSGEKKKPLISGVDPVDTNYEKLHCTMTPLERNCDDWKYVEEFMMNTCGSTHQVHYSLIDIHRLEREGEAEKFKAHLGNRMLLWHGSGRMNYAGILGQGLRIAPPEAPVTGYMFGKGVYFADMFSKSFFYCRSNETNEAYLLLCDVALGTPHNLFQSTTVTKKTLPHGTSSVKGNGREVPNAEGNFYHPEGYVIPKGKGILQSIPNIFNLLYNEYIVYDVDQIRLRYLVRVKVHSSNRHC